MNQSSSATDRRC